MFKRGTQESLKRYLSTYTGADAKQAQEGAFYLTSDTNRLYIGKNISGTSTANIRAVPVNQGAIPVATAANLPEPSAATPGQFYYIVDTNILAVSSSGQWVQINPDHNTTIKSRTTTSASKTIGDVTFTQIHDVITDTDESEAIGNFGIHGEKGLSVTVSEVTDGTVKYPVLKITPTVYNISETVSDGVATITVADDGEGTNKHTSSISIEKGDNVNIVQNGSNIQISATDTTLDNSASEPTDLSFNANGELSFTVGDTSGTTVTGKTTPKIKLGDNATEYKFENGVATLPVYTKTEVDNIRKDFNAMRYMSTVATFANLPTTGVEIGDTYKVTGTNFVIAQNNVNNPSTVSYEAADGAYTLSHGDLLIATGTETDGKITSGLKWDIVESGDAGFDNTTYHLAGDASANKVALTEDGDGDYEVGSLQLKTADDKDYLSITSTVNGNDTVTTIAHKEQADLTAHTASAEDKTGGTQTEEGSLDVVVPVFSYDKAGHITKVESKTYTLTDTHATFEVIDTTGSNDENKTTATVKGGYTYDGFDKEFAMSIKSDHMTVTAKQVDQVGSVPAHAEVTINLEWGTFE